MGNFRQFYVRTTLNAMSASVVGVKLWNSLLLYHRNKYYFIVYTCLYKHLTIVVYILCIYM